MPSHSCSKCVTCDRCSARYCIGDSPVCKGGHGRVHRSSPFQSFTFDADNGEVIEVSSLHKVREIERLSESRHRQGFGRPFNFRVFTQDKSNRDTSIFGRMPKDIEGFNLKRARTRAGKITGGMVQMEPGEKLE